jgi:hypothetical protein
MLWAVGWIIESDADIEKFVRKSRGWPKHIPLNVSGSQYALIYADIMLNRKASGVGHAIHRILESEYTTQPDPLQLCSELAHQDHVLVGNLDSLPLTQRRRTRYFQSQSRTVRSHRIAHIHNCVSQNAPVYRSFSRLFGTDS